jgi:ribosome biogenesis GTPase / thiamine phosphate phosphatase
VSRRTDVLLRLGWDAGYAAAFADLTAEGLRPARVIAEHRGAYVVADALGEGAAVIAGRLRHDARSRDELPAVGDWVALAAGEASRDARVIRTVVPRRSAFLRKVAGDASRAQVLAANVDVALVVTALPHDVRVRRLERYLALAWESGAVPLIVLTKVDLSNDLPAAMTTVRAVAPGVDVVGVSAVSGDGLDTLLAHLLPGSTAVLLGSSGVGKSTLVNRLAGDMALRTAAVRGDGRGRHTTTHRQLVRLAGGALVIDTPGMRELQLWVADAGMEVAFADVQELAGLCRFADCRHDTEPGCAVREAVADGRLDAARLDHWRALERELSYLARRQDEAAAAQERARVKALHRAQRARMRDKGR